MWRPFLSLSYAAPLVKLTTISPREILLGFNTLATLYRAPANLVPV
jgi:hypothetical protein